MFTTHEASPFRFLSLSSLIIDIFWGKNPFWRECVCICVCSEFLKSQGWAGEREGEKVVSAKTTPLVSNLCKQNGGADNSEGKTAVGMELRQSRFPTGIKESFARFP